MTVQNIQTILKAVDNCLFYDDNQGGRLVVALASAALCNATRISLISPFSKELSARKLALIKSYGVLPDSIFEELEVLNLKNNWKSLKKSLSLDFVLKDFVRFVEGSQSDIIILHRLEQFFEIQDRRQIEKFLQIMVSKCRSLGKKLFITLQITHDNAGYIRDQVENYIDLEIKIEKYSTEPHIYDLEITYSIISFGGHHYILEQANQGEVNVYPASLPTNVIKPLGVTQILLISEHALTAHRLGYLLRHTDCQFTVVTPDTSSLISALLTKPDLIVFCESNNIPFDILSLILQHSLPVVVISNQSNTRKLDRLKAIQQGCLDLLEKNYSLEDLLLIIERTINKRIFNFDINGDAGLHFIESEVTFRNRIQALVEQNCYFTVFNLHLDIDKTPDWSKFNCRSFDIYNYDASQNLLKYLAVNMLSHDANLIETIAGRVVPGAKVDSYLEAFEFSTLKD